MKLEIAPTPTKEYSTTKVKSWDFFAILDNFDITVEDVHEFYAEGINVKNCMGKYHPHGSAAIYDALVNMVNLPVALIDGQGNFGDGLFDPAAAERYTECRLSKFADYYLLNKEYLDVTDMHPTYDWAEQEPLYLPALLPNILLNGTSGIAVGVTASIPPFEAQGVLKLANRALAGKEITSAMCVKHLVIKHKNGSHLVSDDQEYQELFETGAQSLAFGVDYTENVKEKSMAITGVTPNFSLTATTTKLEKMKQFARIDNRANSKFPINFVIRFKSDVSPNEIPALCTKVYNMLFARQAYRTNVTHRKSEDDVKFYETTVPQLLMDWAAYRIELEQKCQKRKMVDLKAQIAKQNLLILASQNAMFITKTVRSDVADPRKVIMDKLEITDEDARYILGFTFQQISKLNEDQINKNVVKLNAQYKQAKQYYEAPAEKCQADIIKALEFFS